MATTGLIPWEVGTWHRWAYPLMMLRTEERRRIGAEVTESMQARLDTWLFERRWEDTVVAYDPTTEEGFSYVPRLPCDDDLVRRPQ